MHFGFKTLANWAGFLWAEFGWFLSLSSIQKLHLLEAKTIISQNGRMYGASDCKRDLAGILGKQPSLL